MELESKGLQEVFCSCLIGMVNLERSSALANLSMWSFGAEVSNRWKEYSYSSANVHHQQRMSQVVKIIIVVHKRVAIQNMEQKHLGLWNVLWDIDSLATLTVNEPCSTPIIKLSHSEIIVT